MTLEEFKASLTHSSSPSQVDEALEALWFDARGNWDKAHDIAQEIPGYKGAWIHAYLHRKEGDLGNASYWYSRAGKRMPDMPLQDEWEYICSELLKAP
jgi:hypothetical protein